VWLEIFEIFRESIRGDDGHVTCHVECYLSVSEILLVTMSYLLIGFSSNCKYDLKKFHFPNLAKFENRKYYKFSKTYSIEIASGVHEFGIENAGQALYIS
jgi:hypothetical protein